jgi:hypothetical protein
MFSRWPWPTVQHRAPKLDGERGAERQIFSVRGMPTTRVNPSMSHSWQDASLTAHESLSSIAQDKY